MHEQIKKRKKLNKKTNEISRKRWKPLFSFIAIYYQFHYMFLSLFCLHLSRNVHRMCCTLNIHVLPNRETDQPYSRNKIEIECNYDVNKINLE